MADEDTERQQVLTEPQLWVRDVCAVTGWNVKLMAGRAAKLAKLLREAGGTREELLARFGRDDPGNGWWYWRDDWRGKRGELPSQAAIMECWGRWTLPIAVEVSSRYDSLLALLEPGNGNG